MSTDNVVTSVGFGMAQETLDHLQNIGVKLLHTEIPDDDVDLDAARYGEHTVATLTDDEWTFYKEVLATKRALEKSKRDIAAMSATELADELQTDKSMEDILKGRMESNMLPKGVTDEVAENVSGLERKFHYLFNAFWFHIGEKYEIHNHYCGIRSGRKIVKGQKRTE